MILQKKDRNYSILKKFIIIVCTVPNKNIALSIAKTLITNNLAACVSLFPNIHSIFSWDNKIQERKETQILIKTHIKLEQTIFKYIKTKHPYKTPELLTLKIVNGELNYLLWINNVLKKNTKLKHTKNKIMK